MLLQKHQQKVKSILFIAPATEFGAHPPNGLLSLAAFLREKNYTVGVIDYSGEQMDQKKVTRDIEQFNPDMVATSVLTGPGLSRALLVSDVAKALGKYVIWGGPHVTILPKLTLQYPAVDAVVLGEGEHAILELIQNINGERKQVPNGVGYKSKDGKIVITPPQENFIDLEKKPLPAWDLLKSIDKYLPYRKHNLVFIESHRGCPYRCAFCHHSSDDVKDYGGRYRYLSAQRIMDEFNLIKSLTKKHIDRMDIAGDLQLSGPSHAEKFSKDMMQVGEGVRWWSVTRLHLLNKKAVELMAKAGCEACMLGVESGVERLQRFNGKPVVLPHAIDLTKTMRKNGIYVTNTYMMGHPDETVDELKSTLQYMKKIPADLNLIQIYRPFPGTPYWRFSLQNKKIKEPETFNDFLSFGVLSYHANISKIPDKMLLRTFYRVNLVEQTKSLLNIQRHYLRNGMYEQFFDTFVNNRFTFKLKEILRVKKEKKTKSVGTVEKTPTENASSLSVIN